MPDRSAEERLDHALDAILFGHGDAAVDVEPSLAATIRDLGAIRPVAAPAGARGRVWSRVMRQTNAPVPFAQPFANGHRGRLAAFAQAAAPRPASSRGRLARLSPFLELVAVAALLLGLLGVLGYQRGLLPALPGIGQASATPIASPHVIWRFRTGGQIVTEPVVASGSAYVASMDGFLYAVDTANGQERWRFADKYGTASGFPPAVAGGLVYTCGADGSFHALDAANGQDRWHVRLPASSCLSSPLVTGGLVLFGSDGPNIGYLTALDAATGQSRWQFSAPNAGMRGWAAGAGTVYVSVDNTLYALDAASGRQRWHFKTGVILQWPMVVGDTVFVQGSTNVIIALDAATGKDRWRTAPFGLAIMGGAASGGTLYLSAAAIQNLPGAAGGYQPTVLALDAATGAERWRQPVGRAAPPAPLGLAVSNGEVYAGGGGNTLAALDAATGAIRWRVQLGSPVLSAPAVVGGVVYVGCADGSLYAVGSG